jgi:hypothetical protein
VELVPHCKRPFKEDEFKQDDCTECLKCDPLDNQSLMLSCKFAYFQLVLLSKLGCAFAILGMLSCVHSIEIEGGVNDKGWPPFC